jgi:hypothetical protein
VNYVLSDGTYAWEGKFTRVWRGLRMSEVGSELRG